MAYGKMHPVALIAFVNCYNDWLSKLDRHGNAWITFKNCYYDELSKLYRQKQLLKQRERERESATNLPFCLDSEKRCCTELLFLDHVDL